MSRRRPIHSRMLYHGYPADAAAKFLLRIYLFASGRALIRCDYGEGDETVVRAIAARAYLFNCSRRD